MKVKMRENGLDTTNYEVPYVNLIRKTNNNCFAHTIYPMELSFSQLPQKKSSITSELY